jgi:hypothetical protein
VDDQAVAAAEAAADREARLSRIEQEVKKLLPKTKDRWEKLQVLMPLTSGLLVVIVGYFLTGSVNTAIQRQQLQLSNVKEMRDLLVQLNTGDTAQAEATAFALSAFGRPAVPALVAALAAGGEVRAPAAERALRIIGLSDPDAVCPTVGRVLANHSASYPWPAHLSAVRLAGDLECRQARASLEALDRRVNAVQRPADLAALAGWAAADPALDLQAVGLLKEQLERTLRIVSQ